MVSVPLPDSIRINNMAAFGINSNDEARERGLDISDMKS